MKKFIVLIIVTVIIGFSCGDLTKEKLVISRGSSDSIQKIDNDEADVLSLQLLNKNKIGILKIDFKGDTLKLVSDGDLSWNLFGVNASPKELRKKYLTFSTSRDTMYFDWKTNQKRNGIVLSSNYSYLIFKKLDKNEINQQIDTEHDAYVKQEVQLDYGVIKDSITLAYGIKLGMSKIAFFKKISENSEMKDFYKFNVIMNSDPPGENFDVYFNFKNQILSEVIIKSAF